MAAQTWDSIMNACIVACSMAPAPYNAAPADFVQVQFPMAMSDAELHIYRDMTLLATRTTNIVQGVPLVTEAGSRYVDITQSATQIIVPEGFALIYPAGITDPAQGTRLSFDAGSLDLIDLAWPEEGTVVDPSTADWYGRFWALRDANTLVYSPTADGAYSVEVTGLYQPAPISDANQTTYLSTWYPDLLIDRAMVYLSGALMRNFGAMSEDPKMAASWLAKYQDDLKGAIAEEQRRRSQGVGWSQNLPTPLTAPSARN